MKYIVFENEGEIDIRMIRTFGISAKETDNPIGFFGTGLKYAIAILIRNGCEIFTQAGLTEYSIKKKVVNVRGKDFDMIEMNGRELPFTTHLGVNWENWQAFRELYCNCKDEKGTIHLINKIPRPEPNVTKVFIRGEGLEDLYVERNTIILDMPNSMCHHAKGLDIYEEPNEYFYYRGIRVMGLDPISRFTYNIIDHQSLTEDRTLTFGSLMTGTVACKIASLEDKAIITKILTSSKYTWEGLFNYMDLKYTASSITKEFREVLAKEYIANNDECNLSALRLHAELERERSPKSFKTVEIDEIQKKQLARAIMVCKQLFDDFDNYPIKVVKTLGNQTMALADSVYKEIILSRDCFGHGTKFVVSTLIEEYVHLKKGYDDNSRGMQTYLFDFITTMTEKYITQEPI